MDLRQLRYFIAVVESGSFSAASAKLRISQPSIGQQVRNLEEELGATLLNRHSRGIEVTDTGGKLADYARQIVWQVDEAARAIKNEAAEPFGEIRIGMTLSASAPLAAPLIRETLESYPKITLSITEALSHHLMELLEQDHLDIALAFVGDYPDGLRGEFLAQEDFHFCAPPGHPLANATEVRMDEVLSQPLLLPPESHLLRDQIGSVAADLGVDLNVSVIIQSIGTLVDLVENDVGVTVLPFSAVARHVAEGRVVAMPIVEPSIKRTMSLIHSARRPMTNAELAICNIVRRLVKERIEEGSFKWRVPRRLG